MEKYNYEKKNNIQFYPQNNGGKRIRGSYNFRGRGGHYSEGFHAYNDRNIYKNHQIYNQQYFSNYYPYNQNASLNRIEKYILENYNNLIDINKKNSNILSEINTDCKFFVIKSFSEEDIHKSIKYGVWSSSKNGNIILSKAFNNTKEKGSFVYLLFSCNGSGRYVGVAKMKSSCDFNKTFNYWTQDNKWTGLFNVEWIFIKDVPMKEFQNIIIIMKGGEIKPITYARDTQEIPYDQAKIMLDIFEKYPNSNTILEHFEFYDMRQANYEKNIQPQKMNQYNYFI